MSTSANEPHETPAGDILPKEPWYWKYLPPIVAAVAAFALFTGSMFVALLKFGVSPVVVFVLSGVFFVFFGLIGAVFTGYRAPRSRVQRDSLDWAGIIVLWSVVAVVLFILFAVALSIVAGYPQDLQHLINPAFVRRVDFPKPEISLTPHFGVNYLSREYADSETGFSAKLREKMDIWKEWLKNGASPPHVMLLVYEHPGFQEYYHTTDAILTFDEELRARLADGIAFLRRHDDSTNEYTYRYIRLCVEEKNMDRKESENTTENRVIRLTINANETLVVIVQFAPLDSTPLPCNLEAYGAKLVLVPASSKKGMKNAKTCGDLSYRPSGIDDGRSRDYNGHSRATRWEEPSGFAGFSGCGPSWGPNTCRRQVNYEGSTLQVLDYHQRQGSQPTGCSGQIHIFRDRSTDGSSRGNSW